MPARPTQGVKPEENRKGIPRQTEPILAENDVFETSDRADNQAKVNETRNHIRVNKERHQGKNRQGT